MAWKKGDMDDRKKIREKQRQANIKLKDELLQETQEAEAESLAKMGWSAGKLWPRLHPIAPQDTEHYMLLWSSLYLMYKGYYSKVTIASLEYTCHASLTLKGLSIFFFSQPDGMSSLA